MEKRQIDWRQLRDILSFADTPHFGKTTENRFPPTAGKASPCPEPAGTPHHMQQRKRPSLTIRFRTPRHTKPHPFIKTGRLRILLIHIHPHHPAATCRQFNQRTADTAPAPSRIDKQHLQHLPADPHKRLHRPGGIPYTPQLRHPQPPRHHRRHQRINILFRQKSVRRPHRPSPQRHCLLQCNPPLIRHHPRNQTDLSPENPAHNVLFHPCPFQTANTPPQNTATQSSSGNPPADTDRTFLQPPGLAPQSGDTAGKGHPVRIPPKKRDRLPESSSSPATPEYTAFHLWHCPS